jgi:hypothetical protein
MRPLQRRTGTNSAVPPELCKSHSMSILGFNEPALGRGSAPHAFGKSS